MSKKQNAASSTTSKQTTTKDAGRKIVESVKGYSRDKRVTAIVNTQPPPTKQKKNKA